MGSNALIVHNGIIENYHELKAELKRYNINFSSETDSEVIAHLFKYYLGKTNNPRSALSSTIQKLEGSFAFLLISPLFSKKIFFAKKIPP